MRNHCILAVCLLSAACSRTPSAGNVPPEKLTVAAASDLQFALPELIREFHAAYPRVEVSAIYGSSGNFYSQARNGAPFDLFLSADIQYPRQLAQEGLAAPDSLFTYAVGRIVVWARAASGLDVERLQIHALESASVKHIAIANPQHAPYGRAAEAAMRSLGVYDRVASKLVLGENIAQTLQFVQSGSADVGIVALSLALAPAVRDQGRYWEVPLDAYPRLEQGGVILARAGKSQAAARFRAFLLDATGRSILKQYGFSLSESH